MSFWQGFIWGAGALIIAEVVVIILMVIYDDWRVESKRPFK